MEKDLFRLAMILNICFGLVLITEYCIEKTNVRTLKFESFFNRRDSSLKGNATTYFYIEAQNGSEIYIPGYFDYKLERGQEIRLYESYFLKLDRFIAFEYNAQTITVDITESRQFFLYFGGFALAGGLICLLFRNKNFVPALLGAVTAVNIGILLSML